MECFGSGDEDFSYRLVHQLGWALAIDASAARALILNVCAHPDAQDDPPASVYELVRRITKCLDVRNTAGSAVAKATQHWRKWLANILKLVVSGNTKTDSQINALYAEHDTDRQATLLMLQDFKTASLKVAVHWQGMEPLHITEMIKAVEGEVVIKDFQFEMLDIGRLFMV